MTSKAYAVRGYVRSAPRDPYAEVRAETTGCIASELDCDDGWIEARSWYAADICIREIKADPDYLAAKDFFRFNIGGIV